MTPSARLPARLFLFTQQLSDREPIVVPFQGALDVGSDPAAGLRLDGLGVSPFDAHFERVLDATGDLGRLVPDESARARLLLHGWPGNVRELEGVVHGLLCRGAGPLVGPGELALDTVGADFPRAEA
ncbi:MAG: AAA-type ATPase lid domain-containing protein [Deltaproteobacteria bacterium]